MEIEKHGKGPKSLSHLPLVSLGLGLIPTSFRLDPFRSSPKTRDSKDQNGKSWGWKYSHSTPSHLTLSASLMGPNPIVSDKKPTISYAGLATSTSNLNLSPLTPIFSKLPAGKSPPRSISAKGSSISVCKVRRRGLAPISGS